MTTGMLGIIWALYACSNISVYGFGGGLGKGQGKVRYSYWQRETQPHVASFTPHHTWKEESLLIEKLDRLGAISRRLPPHLAGQLPSLPPDSLLRSDEGHQGQLLRTTDFLSEESQVRHPPDTLIGIQGPFISIRRLDGWVANQSTGWDEIVQIETAVVGIHTNVVYACRLSVFLGNGTKIEEQMEGLVRENSSSADSKMVLFQIHEHSLRPYAKAGASFDLLMQVVDTKRGIGVDEAFLGSKFWQGLSLPVKGAEFEGTGGAGDGGKSAQKSKARVKSRVAVCITGRLDYLPISADNIRAYVLEGLGPGVEVDVFVYSYPPTDQTCRKDRQGGWKRGSGSENGPDWHADIRSYIKPRKLELVIDEQLLATSNLTFCDEWPRNQSCFRVRQDDNSTEWCEPWPPNMVVKLHAEGQVQQMYAWWRVNELRKRHEEEQRMQYDWIVRMRADVLFVQRIPPLEHYAPDRITVPLFHNNRPGCSPCLNDRFAIGPALLMDVYMEQYLRLDRRHSRCHYFEFHLFEYLEHMRHGPQWQEDYGKLRPLVVREPDIQFVRLRRHINADRLDLGLEVSDANLQTDAGIADSDNAPYTNIVIHLGALAKHGKQWGGYVVERLERRWPGLLRGREERVTRRDDGFSDTMHWAVLGLAATK